jgi:hypothetical protein
MPVEKGRRPLYVVALIALLTLVGVLGGGPTSASASLPTYDGILAFPTIHGPSDAEEYSWEVQLGAEQSLEQIDEQHAEVYYAYKHHPAFGITAEAAHDANGATVPTSLSVTEPNVITLIVHHRAGNPAVGGAPFVYPITAGAGWEWTGPPQIVTGPKDETELREEREARENAARQEPPVTVSAPQQEGARAARLGTRPCGKIDGVPVHAHGIGCRAARGVYKADQHGDLPSGWICSASLARCYRGSFDSGRFMWWRRSVY